MQTSECAKKEDKNKPKQQKSSRLQQRAAQAQAEGGAAGWPKAQTERQTPKGLGAAKVRETPRQPGHKIPQPPLSATATARDAGRGKEVIGRGKQTQSPSQP